MSKFDDIKDKEKELESIKDDTKLQHFRIFLMARGIDFEDDTFWMEDYLGEWKWRDICYMFNDYVKTLKADEEWENFPI